MNEIYPNYLDYTRFNLIKVNSIHTTTLKITDFPKEIQFINTFDNINKYIINIYVSKQDSFKILKDLTNNISNTSSELSTVNKNQIDIDILDNNNKKYKDLRYEIQVNNEDIYYTSIYVNFNDENKEILLKKANEYINKLYTNKIISSFLNFRQLEGYLTTLPLGINKLKKEYLNLTTTNLSYLYPFYTKTIVDENGIIFGNISNKICVIDIFSEKYTNSNICIFGSSGSGKSYFTKSIILKGYLNNYTQFILDREGEYETLCNNLNGEIIDINKSYFNIFQILNVNISLEENILKIIEYLHILSDESLTLKEKDLLKEYILKLYSKYDINNINDIYDQTYEYLDRKLKDNNSFPCLLELLTIIKSKRLILKLEEICKNYNIFSNKSNISYKNRLYVFKLNDNNLDKVSYIIIKEIQNMFKKEKNIIYIDEVWKLIKLNKYSSYEIVNLYKTIRKKKGSIVTITQDTIDLFSDKYIEYGKIILNNSVIKLFFKMEYIDDNILSKIPNLNISKLSINKLIKGQALILFQNNNMYLNVSSNKIEKNIIEGDGKYDNSSIR